MSHTELRRTRPLGVFQDTDQVGLIGLEKYSTTSRLVFGHGSDQSFHLRAHPLSIVLPLGATENLPKVSDVRISRILDRHVMSYSIESGGDKQVRIASRETDDDMDIWNVPSINRHLTGRGVVAPEYMLNGQFVLFYGEHDVRMALSKNLVAWHSDTRPLATPRKAGFDHHSLAVVSAQPTPRGLILLYESRETRRGQVKISLGALLCDSTDPSHVIRRTDETLYTLTAPESAEPRVLGAITHDHHIVLYFSTTKDKIIAVKVPNPYPPAARTWHATSLHRHAQNPILSPTAFEWESAAVFNPAAFVSDGRVHLLYRAMGQDGISRIGYASSTDGIHFDERLAHPVYEPTYGFGAPTINRGSAAQHYDPALHPSGGGWAGCEDPRAVTIEGRAYMTFMAFNGWDFMRIALTSISLTDLHHKNWSWKQPVLISRPGEPAKNWVLFPEKINGKYVILHGVSPKIHLEYLDSLDELDGQKFIGSIGNHGGGGYQDKSRQNCWDNRVRGAGAPPLKTPLGWLLLYHANDSADPGKYKLGAMLLDANDPTKILYRTDSPILEPSEWYENDGKPGVVYTCGAVIMNGNLIVYYGGGDKRIAVARANVDAFLEAMAKGHSPALKPVSARTPKPRPKTKPKR